MTATKNRGSKKIKNESGFPLSFFYSNYIVTIPKSSKPYLSAIASIRSFLSRFITLFSPRPK